MIKILLLITGGAIGTVARYAVSGLAHDYYIKGVFPIGTLVVNLIGSFIIGLLWGFWEAGNISPAIRTFIFIGVLGGFTTFSSFSLETFNLLKGGELKLGVINILANNIFGILLVYIGYLISKEITTIFK